MASISTGSDGLRRILFYDRDGERRAVRLGAMSLKAAETIKARVEELLACKVSGCSWPNDVAAWVADLGDKLAAKLHMVGLIPARNKSTLGDFLDAFLKKREKAKPNSLKNYKQAAQKMWDFFGRDINLRSLSNEKAEAWARELTDTYAKAYAGRLVKFARQFFHEAVREKLVTANPFEGIKAQSQANEARKFFITQEMAQKVLDACTDAEWRLIFALARYGGLRCPSEILTLKWADVDWDKGRMMVHAPKTEHHEGGGDRIVPIFPELRPYLKEVWDPDVVHVVTRNRGASVIFRTRMLRIIEQAGLKPWPKLFNNLRASRETELVASFPIHVVCAWIGNSQRIAAKHYLQVTEADFRNAAGNGDAESDARATRNPARSGAVQACTNDRKEHQSNTDYDIVQDDAGIGNLLQAGSSLLSGVVDVNLMPNAN